MRVAVVEEAANRRRARGARFGTSNGSTVTGAAIAAEPGATTSLAAADSCSAARFARICEGLLDPSPSRGRYGSREIGCQCVGVILRRLPFFLVHSPGSADQ